MDRRSTADQMAVTLAPLGRDGGGWGRTPARRAGRSVVAPPRHAGRPSVAGLAVAPAAGRAERVAPRPAVRRREVARGARLRIESVHPGVSVEEVVANTGFD